MEGFDPLIKKAGHFARRAHWGQRRKYRATPYSHHTFRVARRVARHEIGSPVTVAAALLHDTVEDTKVDLGAILGEFGPDVSRLVDELTKLEQDMNLSRTTRFEREIDRLKGISREAKVIKLIDRIDNVRESQKMADDFTKRYLKESAKLAEAIGDADPELKQELLEVIAASM